MTKIQSFIMAGGWGERLWPKSDKFLPKQFIKFFGGYSSFQNTLIRNKSFAPIAVIVQEKDINIAKYQIKEVGIDAVVIAEPAARSTAPCAIIASHYANLVEADNVVLLPVDHAIRKEQQYLNNVRRAANLTSNDNVITLGLKPDYPHCGYGYLRVGGAISQGFYHISQFIEKPDAQNAANYIEEGNYFWNSGIFIFKPESLINIAKEIDPEMYFFATESFRKSMRAEKLIKLNRDSYESIEGNSIDYAFMEKGIKISMIEGDFSWKDVGTWKAIWESYEKDFSDNIISGSDKVYCDKVSGSIIHTEKIPTAVIGLDNIIVINTSDASLIIHKSYSDKVRGAKKTIGSKVNISNPPANDN